MQEVNDKRKWPMSIKDYAAMMDETYPEPVKFTVRGDADYVRFLFFKACIGLKGMRTD